VPARRDRRVLHRPSPRDRRSIAALAHANWWVHEAELETYAEHLKGVLDSAERLDDEQGQGVKADLKLLERFRPAPKPSANR